MGRFRGSLQFHKTLQIAACAWTAENSHQGRVMAVLCFLTVSVCERDGGAPTSAPGQSSLGSGSQDCPSTRGATTSARRVIFRAASQAHPGRPHHRRLSVDVLHPLERKNTPPGTSSGVRIKYSILRTQRDVFSFFFFVKKVFLLTSFQVEAILDRALDVKPTGR